MVVKGLDVISSTSQLPLVADSESLISLSGFRLHLPSSSVLRGKEGHTPAI